MYQVVNEIMMKNSFFSCEKDVSVDLLANWPQCYLSTLIDLTVNDGGDGC